MPPLACAEEYASNDTLTIPYSSSHGRSIPVVYTNDPAAISNWLSENLPRNHGGVLGFDTEVSISDVGIVSYPESRLLARAMRIAD